MSPPPAPPRTNGTRQPIARADRQARPPLSLALMSTPTSENVSNFSASPTSPSCHAARYQTPPRLSADPSSFIQLTNIDPVPAKRHPVPIDDDDGSIFLSSSSAAPSPFFPASTSQPLRTPVKEELRVNIRSILKTKHLNVQSVGPSSFSMPSAARVGVGTKRKSSAQSGGFSMPLWQPVSTPLSISAANADLASGVAFHRLAPLPAPQFGTRTPQSKAETDLYAKRQAETMKRLHIRDMDNSDEDWEVIEDDDSGCEIEEDRGVAGRPLRPLLHLSPIRQLVELNDNPSSPPVAFPSVNRNRMSIIPNAPSALHALQRAEGLKTISSGTFDNVLRQRSCSGAILVP
ncbi:hypothetical protein HYDPIDRAFT_32348 [Hydnomerulius pinastri MD-312]|uniref:Uncharacterized protein n=1 Tax=Hydnomerulius pinastri MD-312 TaxID=994086 RepID=A0A0C9W2V2_9AGAM|nr:hypothetical protein HYDPIDRAFT_32348 [Hydnomerulius pinastri MD-312]